MTSVSQEKGERGGVMAKKIVEASAAAKYHRKRHGHRNHGAIMA